MSRSLLYESSLSDNIQGAAAMPSIPREAILDTVPRSALAATKKIVNLVPISSNISGPNQTIQFLIPQRNLAKAHSFYLKFNLGVAVNANDYSFSGSMASAASLINNITIQAGGVVVESLQNYHLWHNNVLSWAHQGTDELAIESLCSGAKFPFSPPGQYLGQNVASATALPYSQQVAYDNNGIYAGNTTSVGTGWAGVGAAVQQFKGSSGLSSMFSIPIHCGFFNSKEAQLIPLQFINGGVLLTIQTNPIAKAFFENGTALADYVISNMELCYTEITPAPEYILRVREEMIGGKMIKIEAQSYQQYNVQCGTSVRQMFNANLSSLSSIFWGRVIGTDVNNRSKTFQGVGRDADSAYRYEVYLDNVLLFNSSEQLNSMCVQVRQLQEALASSVSDYVVSPFTAARGNIAAYGTGDTGTCTSNTLYTQNMLYGLSTKLFASNSTSMDGTPVGTLTINFQTPGDSTSNVWYLFMVYDYIYLVDATGSVSKNQ
jgi:hypothetical protein